jgi:hypothetical protein
MKENNPNIMKNAFSKIDKFLAELYNDNWMDNQEAIDFAQSIKLNFAEEETILPNMLTVENILKNDVIAFNKLYASTPKSVDDFLKENKDDKNLLRSSVYRTLASNYLESSTDSNGVFVTLKTEEQASESPESPTPEENDSIDNEMPPETNDEMPPEDSIEDSPESASEPDTLPDETMNEPGGDIEDLLGK